MMELAALKPLVTVLLMPLVLLPMLGLLGLVLIARRRPAGWLLCIFATAALWLLSCQAVVVWLSQTVLPQYAPVSALQLKAAKVQAIVVLGSGTLPAAPEYGVAQPHSATTARLRYGIWLARQSGLPVAFTGGSGWAAGSMAKTSEANTEAQIAGRVAAQEFGFTLRWLEDKSRDTAENAQLTAILLKQDGIERIAVVTDALHIARAMVEFERTGLAVTAAPAAYVLPTKTTLLQWLPSAEALHDSTRLAHEVLGLAVARLRYFVN